MLVAMSIFKLEDISITSLAMFITNGNKYLRKATYGAKDLFTLLIVLDISTNGQLTTYPWAESIMGEGVCAGEALYFIISRKSAAHEEETED